MRKKKIFILIISVSLIQLIQSKPIEVKYQTQQTLTIEQAIQYAYKNNPSIHAYEFNIKNYEKQQKSKLSSYIPNVTLSETLYDTQTKSGIQSSAAMQASQTILNFSKMDDYKKAGKTVVSARYQKEMHKNEIRFAIESAFINGWLLQQKSNLIDKLYFSTKETFQAKKHAHELNLLNKNDWLKEAAAYSTNLATVITYQDDINKAEKELAYYTGLQNIILYKKQSTNNNPILKLKLKPMQNFTPHPIEKYIADAIANRNDIKIQQKEIEKEHLESSYYAKQYLPKLSVFGNVSKNTMRTGNSYYSSDAGIKVSWNVFDGLSNYFYKSAADARKTKASLNKEDVIAKVKLEIEQAYSNFRKEINSLDAQRISYYQSYNEFKLEKQRSKLGIISKVDFQTAQLSWEEAKYKWVTQVTNTMIKQKILDYTCGYPKGS